MRMSCSATFGRLIHRYAIDEAVADGAPAARPALGPLQAGAEQEGHGAVRAALGWVTRQQRYFSQFLPRTPERTFVAGETHLYLGRQYRLKVVPHVKESVKLIRGFIVVQTHRPTRPEVTRELIEEWYRDRAHIKFPERIEICLGLFPDPEAFRPKGFIVRQIRQRWGSMSPAGRLLLNRRLVQAPVDAIDYVITHELCHVAEPHHGPAFFELLDKVMPDWERRKQRLERAMA